MQCLFDVCLSIHCFDECHGIASCLGDSHAAVRPSNKGSVTQQGNPTHGDAGAFEVEDGLKEQVFGFLNHFCELRCEHSVGVQAQGVRSVPLYEIGGEIVSGAQSVEQFEVALQRAVGLAGGCADGACFID